VAEFHLPIVRRQSTGSCGGVQQCSARHVTRVQPTTAPHSAGTSAPQHLSRSHFLSRDAMHKRGLCRRAVSVRLSRSCILSKRTNTSSIFFSPSGTHTILVFLVPNIMAVFRRGLPNGGVECRWGRQNRDFRRTSGYRIDDCWTAINN